jgi:hypothetical protein
MWVKCKELMTGIGPSDVLIGIETTDGLEEVILSNRLFNGQAVDVGPPIADEKDRYLIELPRESVKGRWRLWIDKSEIQSYNTIVAAE